MIQIPTDSFYKFLALSGLALVISLFYLIGSYTLILKSEIDNVGQMSKKYHLQEYLEREIKEKEDLEKREIEQSHSILADICLINSRKEPDFVKDNMINAKKWGIKIIQLEIKHKNESIKRLEKLIDNIEIKDSNPVMYFNISATIIQVAMYVFLVIGVCCSVFGFSRWYRLHQKYHDEMLQMQVESARKNSNKHIKFAPAGRRTP